MRKIALFAVLVSGLAVAQTKKVFESDVHWWGYKVAKTAASSHDGTVDVKSGEIKMKGKNVVGGTFILDMNTINATDVTGERQAGLNKHLKDGDFFEVDKYPTATYTITSVTKNNNKSFPHKVNGNLTVKGKTHAVSFPAKVTLTNGVVSIVSDKFSFDRQKFDVTYKSSMKDVLVKDDVDMLVKVSAK